MMKNNLPLWIIAVSLTIILISIPVQNAHAVITALTIDNLVNDNSVSADFTVTYTLTNDDDATNAASGTITFTRTGGTADGGAHVYTMIAGDRTASIAGTAHAISRATLEDDGGFAVLVDGTIYTIDVEVNTSAFTDTVTGITYDTSAPTMDSAITRSITTIDVTFSEDLRDASVAGGDFTLSDGLVVDSILEANGVVTITTTVAFGANDTPTVTLAGAVTDVIDDGTVNTLAAGPTVVATDGIAGSTGGADDIPPSFVTTFDENEYPISIGDTKFTFAELGINNPTTTVEIGKPIRVNLLMYDDFGPTYISQVELYTNTRGAFSGVSNSDTSIIYKSGNPRIVLDPNGFFSEVNFTSSIVNQKLQLTFDITFAKEMKKSDIIVQARDTENNVATLTVSDAWQVIPAQAEETAETPTDESADDSILGEIKVKTLNVEKPSYFMREEILFFGTVDGYKFGSIVSIMIRNPSNNFLTLISTFPDKDGYYEAKMTTDSKFKTDGTYSATAFTDDPNKGTQAIFYFSREAPPPPPPPPVKTSPVQSIQVEPTTTAEPTTTIEPTTISEPVTPKPKPRPSFVDPEKDPQSYVDRYNNEASYKEWFDKNHPDYTIEEAVGIPEPIPGWIKNNAKWWADGQISEDDFVGGIEWLVEQGIIKV